MDYYQRPLPPRLSTPFEVVKTRMQLAPEGTYSSAPDCAVKLARDDGVRALFAGADIIT